MDGILAGTQGCANGGQLDCNWYLQPSSECPPCRTYEKIAEEKYCVLIISGSKKCISQFNSGLSIFLETIPNKSVQIAATNFHNSLLYSI